MVTEMSAKGLTGFSLGVLRERARLAIEDPAGEADAVAPLNYEQAWLNFIWAEGEEAKHARPLPSPAMGHDLGSALNLPPGQTRGMAHCPAHADPEPSLSWARRPDGYVVVKCWGGCSYWNILGALGL